MSAEKLPTGLVKGQSGVVAEMQVQLLAGGYIQADETTVPVQSLGYAAYGNLGSAGLLHFGCFAPCAAEVFGCLEAGSQGCAELGGGASHLGFH